MNPQLSISFTDTSGMGIGTGFVIAMVVMMVLCMGAMMFGMARMGGGSGRSSGRNWSMPWNRFMGRGGPMETLERRFAEGAISADDYRARREALVNEAPGPKGDDRR